MYYLFDEEITVESVNNLMEKLEGQEDINLWFSTHGGLTSAMRCLVEFFNSLKDNIKITLTNCLCSAGVDLLLDYKGSLTYKDLDYILIHKGDRQTYNFRKDDCIDEKILLAQDKKENKRYFKKLKKLGLTEKQLKRFKQGRDVVLYEKDYHLINL